jgi:uncharacterized protein (TIGR03086 family)
VAPGGGAAYDSGMVSDPEGSHPEYSDPEASVTEDAGAWPGLLARACASTGSVLAGVTEAQLAQPTPCADWSVRDLVGHIIDATNLWADLAESGDLPDYRQWPEYAGTDFAGDFGRHAARAIAGFAAPGALDRPMVLPTGPAPGSLAVQVATGEIFVHGWDLAVALGGTAVGGTAIGGRPPAMDDGVAAALLVSDWLVLCVQVRGADPGVFAPEIEPSDGASAADRLAAFLGRDLAWKPGAQARLPGRGPGVRRRRVGAGRVGHLDRRGDELADGTGKRLVEFPAGWLWTRGHVRFISAIPPWTCSDGA